MIFLESKFGECRCQPQSEHLFRCDKCQSVFCGKCIDTRLRTREKGEKFTSLVRCCPRCISTDLEECSSF